MSRATRADIDLLRAPERRQRMKLLIIVAVLLLAAAVGLFVAGVAL